jgi:hypothetical protein
MYGTAAGILKAKYPSSEGAGGDKGGAGFWEKRYEAGLASIDSGAFDADAVLDSRSFAHGFKDSTGTALCDSTLVTGTGLETVF